MSQKQDFIFYDLSNILKSENISLIFPDWQVDNERIMILSPHDDDALLGAGYIIKAAQTFGGQVYVIIYNDGSTGYSVLELKDTIVELRKKETINAFNKVGLPSDNIYRLNIPDFSGINFLGNRHVNGKEGVFRKIVTTLRQLKITRLLIANGYREHLDHTAVYLSGIFDGVQAGDQISIDWGEPTTIRSFLVYSVWGKFSPEDALLSKRDISIRGNFAIAVNKNVELNIQTALKEFKSQTQIIKGILNIRKERRLFNNLFLEVYLKIDPRPRFDMEPYKQLISEIDSKDETI